jgi:hypothetical protein
MKMSDDTCTAVEGSFKDRSAGLVILGSFEILIGLFCAVMIPLSVLAAVATAGLGGDDASPDPRSIASSIVIYGSTAVAFVWLGIGSIRARRWAQKLILVLSWLWLITGVLTIAISMWMVPTLFRQMGLDAAMPSGGTAVVLILVFAMLAVVFVVIPGILVLFYRSPHVAATCRSRDPGPSRIADAPSHILSLVLIYVLGAVSVLTMPAYNFVMPFFETILSGAAGAAAWATVLVLLGYLAWATLDRKMGAWWTAMAATLLAASASTVAAVAVPMDSIFERMALPEDQMAVFASMDFPGPVVLALLSVAAWATLLIYMWYTRRFFDGP